MHHLRRFTGPLAALVFSLPNLAQADGPLVVIELFTAQGCSSCPPADLLLEQMAKNVEVLPLAFHVDYWDYLGWQDQFATPAHTARQKDYAHAAGERMIYTPQAIVNGAARVIGSDSQALMSALMHEMNKDPIATLSLTRSGESLDINGTSLGAVSGPVEVLLVRYVPQASVEILHGENAGKTVKYINIVSSVTPIGQWAGNDALSLTVPITGTDSAAVLLQSPDMGPVIAAALVR